MTTTLMRTILNSEQELIITDSIELMKKWMLYGRSITLATSLEEQIQTKANKRRSQR